MVRHDMAQQGIVTLAQMGTPEDQIVELRDLVNDDLFFIDLNRCDLLVRQLEGWRLNPATGKPFEGYNKADDACDACRYVIGGIKHVERRRLRQDGGQTGASESPWRPQTAASVSRWRTAGGIPSP
jgi:hypothetical protein